MKEGYLTVEEAVREIRGAMEGEITDGAQIGVDPEPSKPS